MTRHVVAPVDELPPGSRKFLTIDERPIAIFNIKGEYFALANTCPHEGASLCKGKLATRPAGLPYAQNWGFAALQCQFIVCCPSR